MSENSTFSRVLQRIMPAMNSPRANSHALHYSALASRDSRFDGQFFVAVRSTRIYCRPICRVRLPKPENCSFYTLPAQAEAAGYRPCLRCRPELAPQVLGASVTAPWSAEDASETLARQALQFLNSSKQADGAQITTAAQSLGISDRHLRRIFQAQWGISPLQWLQTQRLLTAKFLLTDTRLPLAEIASTSGFGSLRRFQAAFSKHYRLAPGQLRRETRSDAPLPKAQNPVAHPWIEIRLGLRPPYDAQSLFQFWQTRQINAIELVAAPARSASKNTLNGTKNKAFWSDFEPSETVLSRGLCVPHAGQVYTGWMQACLDGSRSQLRVRLSESLASALPSLAPRLRQMFDLDADPSAIEAVLSADFPGGQGMRVPGALDGFEVAVRAIIGQQVSVAAARTLCERVVRTFGEPITTPWPGITHLFPTAQRLAQALPEELGALGIVRQRQAALIALGRAVASGQIDLNAPVMSAAELENRMQALQNLPGIGAWTAQYIAMRALRYPDAFPAGDIAIHNALDATHGLRQIPSPLARARAAEEISQRWRPWRSYAVLRLWAGLYAPSELTKITPKKGAFPA